MSAQPHRTIAMPRAARTSRVTRGVCIAAGAALLTAGCAAGQVAQTAYQKSTIDGINKSVGAIDLRNVAIESPPGQQPFYRPGTAAPMTVVFVNNGRSADVLTGIKTSVASGYGYFTDYNQAHAVEQAAGASVTGSPSASASESPSESSSSSESPSGSPSESPSGSESTPASGSASGSTPASGSPSGSTSSSPSPSGSSSAALPTGATSFSIPAGGRVSIATPESNAALLLTGISRALYPATTVNVTFTFRNAGSVVVPVPVQVATLGRAAEVPGGGEGEEG